MTGLAVFLGACNLSSFSSEDGQFQVDLHDLRSTDSTGLRASMPVLVGSETGLSVQTPGTPEGCTSITLDGTPVPDRVRFDALRTFRFASTPSTCPETSDATPDRLTLDVIDADGVVGRIAPVNFEAGIAQVELGEARVVGPDPLPDDLLPQPGDTTVLVAGETHLLTWALEKDGALVMHSPEAATLVVEGDATLEPPLDEILFTVTPGAEGKGRFDVAARDATIRVGPWVSIAPARLDRLEFVALGAAPEGEGGGMAVGVWGVDDEGRRVHGLPLDVEVLRGPLAVPEGGQTPGIWLGHPGDCVPPSEWVGRRVRRSLAFRYAEHEVVVDLAFDARDVPRTAETTDDSSWEPERLCMDGSRGGCGCASAGPAGGLVPLALGLLVAALGRRRRRAS